MILVGEVISCCDPGCWAGRALGNMQLWGARWLRQEDCPVSLWHSGGVSGASDCSQRLCW